MINPETIQGYIDEINRGMRLELPEVEGYSSAKVRNLLNKLVSNQTSHYLEIGVHLGSTFIPAIYGNKTTATCIDDWSRFGNLRPRFEENLRKYGLLTDRINIIGQDSWTVDLKKIRAHGGLVDTYFYDGDHNPDNHAHYKAVEYYLPVLTNDFLMVIDDANYPGVKEPTYEAMAKNNVKIIKEWRLPGPYNGGPDEWWNALLVLICQQ